VWGGGIDADVDVLSKGKGRQGEKKWQDQLHGRKGSMVGRGAAWHVACT
jgi:hypothetical protein